MKLLVCGAVLGLVIACGAPQKATFRGSSECEPAVEQTDDCAPTWAGTIANGKAFCGGRGKMPGFGLGRSKAPCGRYLRYTLSLFDGGPRNCLYDPKTEKLVGYANYDAKAGWQQRTCSVEDHDANFPQDCAALTCADAAFGGADAGP